MPIRVGGVKFKTAFLVLDVTEAYEMLLGRPWLRAAGAIHDWGTGELTMQLKNNKVSVDTRPTTVPIACRPSLVHITEPTEVLARLKTTGIGPAKTMDLN